MCEAALAMAEVDAGLVPLSAAQTIARCCDVERLDAAAIAAAMADQEHALTPVLAALGHVVAAASSEEVGLLDSL